MKTVLIMQARMSSSRLPGKVLRKVAGRELLEYELERLKAAKLVDDVVIATTHDTSDDAIANFCKERGTACFRGSTDDVLERYYQAAKEIHATTVARVTGDCPLVDPEVIDQILGKLRDPAEGFDYVSNTQTRTYPRGLDCEAFSFDGLAQAYREATLPGEREHVTPFFYTHPNRYKIGQVVCPTNYSQHRWTVDTPEDFTLLEILLTRLGASNRDFSFRRVLEIVEKEPELSRINTGVEQKHWKA